MIPHRYMNATHALGLIRREEGFKGLYRGFSAHIVAQAVIISAIPFLAELSMMQSPLMGYIKDLE